MTKALLSALIRPLAEPRLPEWVEPLWFANKDEALALAPEAEIGWFDLNEKEPMIEIARAAASAPDAPAPSSAPPPAPAAPAPSSASTSTAPAAPSSVSIEPVLPVVPAASLVGATGTTVATGMLTCWPG